VDPLGFDTRIIESDRILGLGWLIGSTWLLQRDPGYLKQPNLHYLSLIKTPFWRSEDMMAIVYSRMKCQSWDGLLVHSDGLPVSVGLLGLITQIHLAGIIRAYPAAQIGWLLR